MSPQSAQNRPGTNYLALLRGINVGGKNLVKMAELRLAFERQGLTAVATYIQSGNVLFRAPRQRREDLAARLETGLSRRFALDLKLVLLTRAQMRAVVEGAPPEFASETHLCDVIFLRRPLSVGRVMRVIELRDGVDGAWPGKGVVYFSRLADKASGSRLSKLVARPEYMNMTIRNWRTTRKLLELIDESA